MKTLMDSLNQRIKANEKARRKVDIDDLFSIEYAAGYSAALNQMKRDLLTLRHDLMKTPFTHVKEVVLLNKII